MQIDVHLFDSETSRHLTEENYEWYWMDQYLNMSRSKEIEPTEQDAIEAARSAFEWYDNFIVEKIVERNTGRLIYKQEKED